MKDRTDTFLRILSIEISDMEEGVEVLLASTAERHSRHEITEYVWTENSALLKHELHILQIIHAKLDGLDPNQFESIEALITAIRADLDGREDLPRALYSFFMRKIEKVKRYMEQE
jgi:hypothetical protein